MFEQLLRDNFSEFYLHDSMSQGEGFSEWIFQRWKIKMISLVYVQLIRGDRMTELKDPFISVIVSDVRVTALHSIRGKHTHTLTMQYVFHSHFSLFLMPNVVCPTWMHNFSLLYILVCDVGGSAQLKLCVYRKCAELPKSVYQNGIHNIIYIYMCVYNMNSVLVLLTEFHFKEVFNVQDSTINRKVMFSHWNTAQK